MADRKPRLLLANGEQFVSSLKRGSGGGPKEEPRSYDEARVLVRSQLEESLERLESIPSRKRHRDEAILCLRMNPGFLAKSYDPQHIFQQMPELKKIGSRQFEEDASKYENIKPKAGKETVPSRMIFVRGQDSGFRNLMKSLDRRPESLSTGFMNEICRIERFDLQTDEERLSAFETLPDWEGGRVEFVLHPSGHPPEDQFQLMLELFPDSENFNQNPRYAPYGNGPFFLSARLDREELAQLRGVIPLRTAHPLIPGSFEDLRSAPTHAAPPPPIDDGSRASTIVGLFDGGIDPSNPLLSGHAEHHEDLSIAAPSAPEGVAHGTAVAGLILHGPLNSKDKNTPLPTPPVSVASFRVLPTSDPNDIDLYESIDVIEQVVPSRSDISVYNVSLGPQGPIFDDSISRFTYALDVLAKQYRVTFCVAVGNDGDQPAGWNRIQAPADSVNSLGVGAWTQNGADIQLAPYSCIGPGREGAKIKPDVVAFGGCENSPIHAVSMTPGHKVSTQGTSFSTPLVSSLVGQAIGGVDRGSALLARAMVVHSANHPSGKPDHEFGHGAASENLVELLSCGENDVTIAFQGSLSMTKSVKLPFLLPPGVIDEGSVTFQWTIAILPEVDPLHPDDYTKYCIEEHFYPHDKRYAFNSPPGGKKVRKVLHEIDDADEIQKLLARGFKKSGLPCTDSGNKYKTEGELREDMKWEPIVKRVVTKRASSLFEPFLSLDAIPRHDSSGRVDYAVLVTIKPNRDVDLYSAILQRYPALQPIRLRTEAELRIRV